MTIDFPRETEIETKNEMDAVLQAGRVLMESGAEIYRIEDTMGHMAKSLGIRDFSTYVVNRGVMISGLNRSGLKESRVLATSAPSIHLGKLEEVNRLSRELAEQPNQPVSSIFQKLKTIEQKTFYRPLEDIIACVIGAGSFSLALGSSWIDGTAAAISGLFVGIGMQLFSRFIHTSFLQIILSSAIAALSANVLYYLGIGQHRSVIILGTLMILIPGAYFVNAIREFTQNNYYSGLALMLSGVSTCLSISVGVLAMISLLPFAEQLSGMFSTPSTSWQEVLIQTFMAGLGTAAFSVLYRVPQEILLRPRNPRCRLMAPLPLDLEQYPSRSPCHPLSSPSGHIHLTLFGPLPQMSSYSLPSLKHVPTHPRDELLPCGLLPLDWKFRPRSQLPTSLFPGLIYHRHRRQFDTTNPQPLFCTREEEINC